ncbi:MAG TPA: FAD-dependent oxidoreductase [Bryobacterales bacterium]|nr:FAD-dependent oxidoreductase [Bryobacterales bacterium]
MIAGERPRLVILGTGFAAFQLVKFLDRKSYDVTVVSRRNHFLFTPLLPSTTVGTVEFRSIIEPARRPGARFYHAACVGIDPAGRRVCCRNAVAFDLEYDLLVIAVGAASSSYGVPGVEEHALHLRELNDARNLRQRILGHLETAALPGLPEEARARLLHFVICGGGPTGVEVAAELHDLLLDEGRRYFPELVDQVRITLVEAGPDILSAFDAKLRRYAADLFRRERIEVRTGTPVVRVEKDGLELKNGEWLPYGVLLWSAGNGPTELVRSLPLPKNPKGRILVDGHLRVPGCENIYALGDCAANLENPLPETAQVAMKQGRYLARALNRMARGKPADPLEYHHLGMLAYLGGNRALADLPNYKGKGWAAWLFWRSAYLTRLLSIRTKMQVLFNWISSQIFGRDISRF